MTTLNGNLPPALEEMLGNLFTRVAALERRRLPDSTTLPAAPATDTVAAPSRPVAFSYPSALIDGVESPPWYPPDGSDADFTDIRLSRLVAGLVSLVVDINVNGSTVHTVTLTAGNVTVVDATAVNVPDGEPLTVVVNSGTNASDVTVEFDP